MPPIIDLTLGSSRIVIDTSARSSFFVSEKLKNAVFRSIGIRHAARHYADAMFVAVREGCQDDRRDPRCCCAA